MAYRVVQPNGTATKTPLTSCGSPLTGWCASQEHRRHYFFIDEVLENDGRFSRDLADCEAAMQ